MLKSSVLYKFLPLGLFTTYMLATLCVSFFGPIVYKNYNKSSTLLYILSFLVIFSLGYIVGIFIKPSFTPRNTRPSSQKQTLRVVKIFILLAFNIKLIAFCSLLFSGGGNISPLNAGKNYVEFYEGYVRGEGIHDVYYIATVFSEPIYLVALILGFFYFKELSKTLKLLFFSLLCMVFFYYTIGLGKQKQIGDILIYLFSVPLVYFPLARQKIKVKIALFGIASCVMGVLIICSSLFMRYNAMDINASNINDRAHPLVFYDTDHIVFDKLGNNIGFAASAFSFYLSNGYYGLSLSMEQPFRWTHMRGHSYSSAVFSERYLGMSPVLEDTYPYRTGEATGWNQAKWHSVFSWLASDFTFLGTLFISLFIGFIYARTWTGAYLLQSPTAVLLFSTINLGLVFAPANNQLLHTPEGTLSTGLFFILWLFPFGLLKINKKPNRLF